MFETNPYTINFTTTPRLSQTMYHDMILCDLAYRDKEYIKHILTQNIGESGNFGYVRTQEDLMYWCVKNKVLTFVFSGTRNMRAWKKNIKMVKSSLPAGKTIHQGFYDSWVDCFKQSVTLVLWRFTIKHVRRDALQDMVLDPAKVNKVRFIGHSRGGALAILALRDVVKNRGIAVDMCESVVFGAPRIGNKQFVTQLIELGIVKSYDANSSYNQKPCLREVINGFDPVTNLPLEVFDYVDTTTVMKGGDTYTIENSLKYGNFRVKDRNDYKPHEYMHNRVHLKQPWWHSLPFVCWLDHTQKSYLKALKNK